jgi:hypothetical protein
VPALPQQDHAQIQGRIDAGFAGPFLGGPERLQGGIKLAGADLAQAFPE